MARILIVDDEPQLCDLFKTLLKCHGHEVLVAYTGRDGLDAYAQLRPQFTFLDLRMPGMNGIEVLRAIRAIDPKATVMILTGAGSEELEQEARQLGAKDFLSKALSLDTIVRTMERALNLGKTDELKGAPGGLPKADSILLMDANPQTRDCFGQVLKQGGYEVHVAPDVFAAMQVMEKERPRLIVVDVDMPAGKGMKVLRQFRARNYTGGLIAMTSSEDEQLLKTARDVGLVDILVKPVDSERLLLAIQLGLVFIRQ